MHQSAYKLSRRHSEKAVASERRKRIDDFATRLMRALEEGHLTCRTQPRDFDDFLKGASGRFLPERAYIHFNDLLAWLREQGYVDHSAPNALGPAFQAYEEREIALAEEVANDIRVRRSLHGKRAPEGWENVLPPISAEDERLRLQEQLSDAIKKIQVLEQQVLALHPPAGDEITEGTRASRSDLLIITALFELAKINPAGASATTALALQISKFLRSLDPATIRRRVKGAAALRGRIAAELNASTEHRKK